MRTKGSSDKAANDPSQSPTDSLAAAKLPNVVFGPLINMLIFMKDQQATSNQRIFHSVCDSRESSSTSVPAASVRTPDTEPWELIASPFTIFTFRPTLLGRLNPLFSNLARFVTGHNPPCLNTQAGNVRSRIRDSPQWQLPIFRDLVRPYMG